MKSTPPADPTRLEASDEATEQRSVGDEVNETVQDMLPWGISFLFHMALVLLALFVVWSATLVLPDDETPSVPRLELTSSTPSMVEVPQIESVTQTPTAAPHERPHPETPIADPVDPTETTADFGQDMPTPPGGSPIDGMGETGNASSTIFGRPSGPSGGDVDRIVFLVDASGSLIADLPFVVKELKRSIQTLDDQQHFQVIFYRGSEAGQPIVRIPLGSGLIRATDANKKAAIRWLSDDSAYAPGGRAEPIAAIQAAFSMNPELIFLLSDNIDGSGIYESNQRTLLDAVARMNAPRPGDADRHAMICTIQFIDKPMLYGNDTQGTLEKMALDNGGEFRFIRAGEVGLDR